MSQSVQIPEGVTFKVEGRIGIKPGRQFRRGKPWYGMRPGHTMHTHFNKKGDETGLVNVVFPEPPKKDPFYLLHTNPARFFANVVRDVLKEMPLKAKGA